MKNKSDNLVYLTCLFIVCIFSLGAEQGGAPAGGGCAPKNQPTRLTNATQSESKSTTQEEPRKESNIISKNPEAAPENNNSHSDLETLLTKIQQEAEEKASSSCKDPSQRQFVSGVIQQFIEVAIIALDGAEELPNELKLSNAMEIIINKNCKPVF